MRARRSIPAWVLVRDLAGGGRSEERLGVSVVDVSKAPPPTALELVHPDGTVQARYRLVPETHAPPGGWAAQAELGHFPPRFECNELRELLAKMNESSSNGGR